MGRHGKYCKWGDSQLKFEYELQMTQQLISDLLDKGAQFFNYYNNNFFYLNGEIYDIGRKDEVLEQLAVLGIMPPDYPRDVVEWLKSKAEPICKVIPRQSIGTVQGIQEPKGKYTRLLTKSVRKWVLAVIKNGRV